MALVIPKAGIRLSGRLGDFVYRNLGDRTIIARAPAPSNRPPTERQLAARHRFCLATAYATASLSNPPARAFYTKVAATKNKSPFAAAQSDYLSAPVIHDISLTLYQGHPDDEVVIFATDDTEVVSVKVTIKDMVGKIVEQGDAELRFGAWLYVAKEKAPTGQPLTVVVTAMDRPGNEVTRTGPWVAGTSADVWVPHNGCEASPPSRTTPRLIT